MLGLAAAPEIATAVPRLIPFSHPGCLQPEFLVAAYDDCHSVFFVASRVNPAKSGVKAKDRALRVCSANSLPRTTFKLVFRIGNGRASLESLEARGICKFARGRSSASENPVKGCALRSGTDAPR